MGSGTWSENYCFRIKETFHGVWRLGGGGGFLWFDLPCDWSQYQNMSLSNQIILAFQNFTVVSSLSVVLLGLFQGKSCLHASQQ